MPRWLARAPSVVIALAMMLAVPVATLRTPDEVTHCCCPSAALCKCPDHRGEVVTQPILRTCHRTTHALATTTLAAFAPPPTIAIAVPRQPVRVTLAEPPAPHPAPPPPRPDAPS